MTIGIQRWLLLSQHEHWVDKSTLVAVVFTKLVDVHENVNKSKDEFLETYATPNAIAIITARFYVRIIADACVVASMFTQWDRFFAFKPNEYWFLFLSLFRFLCLCVWLFLVWTINYGAGKEAFKLFVCVWILFGRKNKAIHHIFEQFHFLLCKKENELCLLCCEKGKTTFHPNHDCSSSFSVLPFSFTLLPLCMYPKQLALYEL